MGWDSVHLGGRPGGTWSTVKYRDRDKTDDPGGETDDKKRKGYPTCRSSGVCEGRTSKGRPHSGRREGR